ncbi:helix-turn-helix domain-containing protein [Streptomyces sp. NPDC048644]|uniref:helix-turn-helix domain-containing protein n=1 Tax=Streptomyces sp. NPDC048644 TaxID=3365582 RepID=UPI00371823D9
MHVDDLLQLDDLDLTLLWSEGPLLAQEVRGVTAAAPEAPETYPHGGGELVLSGLEWWTPGDGGAQADRFVAALRSAGAAALVADEGTHGTVPQDLVAACRTHRVPLLSVPAQAAFRAVTEAVTEAVHLRHRQAVDRRAGDGRRAADEWAALAAAPPADGAALTATVGACGLPSDGPYRVVVAACATKDATPGDGGGPAAGALAEALAHAPGTPFAVGRLPGGEAVALVATGAGDTVRATLGDLWPALRACAPDRILRAGISGPARTAELTGVALEQARYALAAARQDAPGRSRVTAVEDLTSLASLLAGVPRPVRTAFSRTVLGPLAGASHRMLLETLEVFLARHGSWARTAEALHLHVNTVRYRIQRIELLTGRDLSRLDHKLDLRAALLCR